MLATLAALVLLVAAGALYVLWPRPATPITEEDALAEYRAQGTGSVVTTVAGAPPDGVFRYTASGKEEVSIGGVPIPARDVPELVTIVVRSEGACTTSTLNLMAEHTETSTTCRDATGGLVLRDQSKFQQVAGFTTRGTTTCAAGGLGAPGGEPRPVQCTLRLEVAGTTLVVDLLGTARWEAPEAVAVAGELRSGDRLVIDLAASGDLAGHWTERQWLDQETATPLRIERDVLLDGPGRFAEATTLELLDLTPSR